MTATDTEVIEIELTAPAGQIISYDHRRLCSALGVADPACLTVETDGLTRALVTVYRRPPLENLPPARGEDLAMDARGYVTVGRYHDGQPARIRLYEPGSGAQRGALFGTTGAGKSRALQLILAAEKRSRIVSWLADLKGGQSVPEARGQVDWHVTTPEGAILMLRAAVAVGAGRMTRYASLGRSLFVAARPDPLLSVRIDEANRLLEAGSPYRDEAAHLIRELGRTGRSVGVGVSLAAQAGHIEELGGSDTLRAMLKEGDTVLLRWSSSMMASLVSDGLLPPGTDLVPIPRRSGPPRLRSRFDPTPDEQEDGASTAGMAYLLGSHRPTAVMRFFRVGSSDPVDGPDPAILDLYGPGEPARLEHASHPAAGEAYAARGGPITATTGTGDQAGAETAQQAAPASQEAPQVHPAPAVPAPRTGRGQGQTAAARIIAALAAGPLTKQELVAALGSDGGRALSASRISAALSELTSTGQITSPERGRYQLPH